VTVDSGTALPLRILERALASADEELATSESIAEAVVMGHLLGPAESELLRMTIREARRKIGHARNARAALDPAGGVTEPRG